MIVCNQGRDTTMAKTEFSRPHLIRTVSHYFGPRIGGPVEIYFNQQLQRPRAVFSSLTNTWPELEEPKLDIYLVWSSRPWSLELSVLLEVSTSLVLKSITSFIAHAKLDSKHVIA